MEQLDKDAGATHKGSDIDWSLWNDEEFHQPTSEEQRQMQIEAGGDSNGSMIEFDESWGFGDKYTDYNSGDQMGVQIKKY